MLRFILLSLGFGIAFFLSDYFNMSQYLPEQKWSILLFFTVLSLYFSRMLARGFDNKREYLVQFSLIYKVSKLLLSIVFVGLVLYKGVAKPFNFIITFFVLYLFYTFFEVLFFNRKLRQN